MCGSTLANAERLAQISTNRRQLRTVLEVGTGLVIVATIAGLFLVALLADVCDSADPDCVEETETPTPGDRALSEREDASEDVLSPTAIKGGMILLGLISLGSFGGSLSLLKRRQLLADVPSSATNGVFIGLNQVDGTVVCSTPHTTCQGNLAAVINARTTVITIERSTLQSRGGGVLGEPKQERQVRDYQSDRRDSSFLVKDEWGAVQVDSPGATLHTVAVDERTRSLERGGREEIHHTYVPVGSHVTVLGPVALSEDGLTPRIARDPSVGPFHITVGGEEEQLRSDLGWLRMLQGSAIAASAAIPAFLGGPLLPRMLIGPALILTLDLLIYLVFVYNSLVRLRHSVSRSLSLIDVQLHRRSTLIPQLAEVVGGYARHEGVVLEQIVNARMDAPDQSLALNAEHVAGTETSMANQANAMRSLLAVAENYPELRADQRFADLQRELVSTEDRVAVAQRFYNDARLRYRQRAEQVPGIAVAWAVGMVPPEPMKSAPARIGSTDA